MTSKLVLLPRRHAPSMPLIHYVQLLIPDRESIIFCTSRRVPHFFFIFISLVYYFVFRFKIFGLYHKSRVLKFCGGKKDEFSWRAQSKWRGVRRDTPCRGVYPTHNKGVVHCAHFSKLFTVKN